METPPSPPCSTAWPIASLLLRLLTFISLVVSLVVLVRDSFSYYDSSVKSTATFKNFYAYSYVVTIVVFACVYTAIWIPFAVCHACWGKTPTVSARIPQLNLCMDSLVLLMLATGIGAAFGMTVDAKRIYGKLQDDMKAAFGSLSNDAEESFAKIFKFLDTGYISACFLLGATISTAAMVVGSAISRSRQQVYAVLPPARVAPSDSQPQS